MALLRSLGRMMRLPRRLRRDQSGASAIEFAFVALPLFASFFAIMETALSFFTSSMLETALADAARTIMTGQTVSDPSSAQANATKRAEFQATLCDKLKRSVITCSAVQFDVQNYTDGTLPQVTKPISNGEISWSPQFNTGKPGDLVIVRVIYPMPTYTNILGTGLANLKNGKMLLMATAAFRNEPYQNGTSE